MKTFSRVIGQMVVLGALGVMILLGCGRSAPGSPANGGVPLASPTATLTPLPPSPTPVPLAAIVNGTPITLNELQAETARVQAAAAQLGMNLAPAEAQRRALEDLIDQTLLAQAAAEAGFDAQAAADQAWADLQASLGSSQALTAYLAVLGFDEQGYRLWLARSLAAAWMRDRIADRVPRQAEQVHVQQILIYNEQEAQQVWQRLQNGADFAQLAAAYDPQTRGDLGWFPRGYLDEPALEEAAFQLEVGAFSQVIQTRMGYHILKVLAREAERPLSTQALQVLQQRVVAQWLQERRQQSTIRIEISPGPTPSPTREESNHGNR